MFQIFPIDEILTKLTPQPSEEMHVSDAIELALSHDGRKPLDRLVVYPNSDGSIDKKEFMSKNGGYLERYKDGKLYTRLSHVGEPNDLKGSVVMFESPRTTIMISSGSYSIEYTKDKGYVNNLLGGAGGIFIKKHCMNGQNHGIVDYKSSYEINGKMTYQWYRSFYLFGELIYVYKYRNGNLIHRDRTKYNHLLKIVPKMRNNIKAILTLDIAKICIDYMFYFVESFDIELDEFTVNSVMMDSMISN